MISTEAQIIGYFGVQSFSFDGYQIIGYFGVQSFSFDGYQIIYCQS